MSRAARTARAFRHAAPAWGVAPGLVAILLALAMVSQAAVGMWHGLSHAGPAAVCTGHGHRHKGQEPTALATAHEHGPAQQSGPAHREGDPGHSSKGCDLCAVIAVGKLGWATPPVVTVDRARVSRSLDEAAPGSPLVAPRLTVAAPRGPPARA